MTPGELRDMAENLWGNINGWDELERALLTTKRAGIEEASNIAKDRYIALSEAGDLRGTAAAYEIYVLIRQLIDVKL